MTTSAKESWRRGRLDEATIDLLAQELSGAELQSALLEGRAAAGQTPRTAGRAGATESRPLLRAGARGSADQPGYRRGSARGRVAVRGVELSPLAPLGATSTFSRSDQNRVVSSLRGTEVVSDPTNVLALHSALLLREKPEGLFHYATSQRVVRAQPVPKLPNYSQHFRLFALSSAGVERKDHGFTRDALLLQLRAVLAGLDRLEKSGYAFGARRIDWLATPERASLAERVSAALGLPARQLPLDHAYYSAGLRFRLWLTTASGEELPVVDGGAFDWLSRLTANRRAVFVATGLGSQLLPAMFRRPSC